MYILVNTKLHHLTSVINIVRPHFLTSGVEFYYSSSQISGQTCIAVTLRYEVLEDETKYWIQHAVPVLSPYSFQSKSAYFIVRIYLIPSNYTRRPVVYRVTHNVL
jgi:hypothetical protein